VMIRPEAHGVKVRVNILCRTRLDQLAFNRNRLKAEKLIGSRVLEQLICVP
jgi:hypothetical protein